MRVTIVFFFFCFCAKNLIFAYKAGDSEQLASPLKECTDLLKDLGPSAEKIQATETRLKALENRLQELMSGLANSEAQIAEIKTENRDRPKVAFSASVGCGGFFGPFNTDVTLVYKNVIMNVGNAYNQATGIFTAPVRGVYYFSFFYHCGVEEPTVLILYRNGNLVAITKHHKSRGDPVNGGNGVTLLLEKGEQVYIVLQKNTRIWDTDNITVFSGFLISAM